MGWASPVATPLGLSGWLQEGSLVLKGGLAGEIPAGRDQDGEFRQTLISQQRASFWKGLDGLQVP